MDKKKKYLKTIDKKLQKLIKKGEKLSKEINDKEVNLAVSSLQNAYDSIQLLNKTQ